MKFRRGLFVVLVAVAVGIALVAGFLTQMRRWLVIAYTPDYREVAARAHKGSGTAPLALVRWVQVAAGFTKPTAIEFVPGGRGLAIVLEQGGKAKLVDLSHAGDPRPSPASPGATVLELAANTDAEMGLLGFAFHPHWRDNGRVFVHWNPAPGPLRTHVAEYVIRPNELGAAPAHDPRLLFAVPQPYGNHKGGQLVFGADGFLYIGLGDGGWRYDPNGNGQALDTLLGKILRIDVDQRGSLPYGIPADNPFAHQRGARPEIWAYGLRNPWRFSFDELGRAIVGDVGQDRFEEVDVVRAGDDLGWNVREGTHCFSPKAGCRTQGLVEPVFEYGREAGSCIVGGYVYRGSSIPDLVGKYVFGDFISGALWAIPLPSPYAAAGTQVEARDLGKSALLVSSFGRDEAGEIYALDFGGGGIYRLAPVATP